MSCDIIIPEAIKAGDSQHLIRATMNPERDTHSPQRNTKSEMQTIREEGACAGSDMPETSMNRRLETSPVCKVKKASEPEPSVKPQKSKLRLYLERYKKRPMTQVFYEIQKSPMLDTVPEETPEVLAFEEQQALVSTQQQEVVAAPETPQVNDLEESECDREESFTQMTQLCNDFMDEQYDLDRQLERDRAIVRDAMKSLMDDIRFVKARGSEAAIASNTRSFRLHMEFKEQELKHEEAFDRVRKLENDLEEEKKLKMEAETSLEEERKENARLVSAVAQLQEDLRRENLLWQEEKAGLLQSIQDQKETLEKLDTEREDIERRMDCLKEQVKEMRQKPKKLSRWRRFLNLFRR